MEVESPYVADEKEKSRKVEVRLSIGSGDSPDAGIGGSITIDIRMFPLWSKTTWTFIWVGKLKLIDLIFFSSWTFGRIRLGVTLFLTWLL